MVCQFTFDKYPAIKDR